MTARVLFAVGAEHIGDVIDQRRVESRPSGSLSVGPFEDFQGMHVADLDGDNVRAVYGYATDLAKLPRTQFGYFADGDELATAVGDIGRRWSGMLGFGHRTGVSFA